jgi:hypothetical protein
MDWERVLINFGVVSGLLAVMSFWIGIALWLWVDANKHGMVGWVWIYVGLLSGPVGLIAYILYRGDRPVLEIVRQRDALLAEISRTHLPNDYDPAAPPVVKDEG